MRRKFLYLLLSAALAVPMVGCGETAPAGPAADCPFTVDILSTGKSDCAIVCMDGLTILCDTADANDYDEISERLAELGVTRIDYMVLSHYDKDHIGSAPALLKNFDVGTVLRPNYREKSDEYYALVDAVADQGTESVTLTEDYTVTTENGQITVDPPDRDYDDDNNNSLVLTVTWQGRRLLFLGDAKKQRMEEFLSVAEQGYDFIKLPHHGDSNGPLLELLRTAPPRWAAETVESGKLIEPELLETLEELQISLYCTCDGDILLWWDGSELQAKQ